VPACRIWEKRWYFERAEILAELICIFGCHRLCVTAAPRVLLEGGADRPELARAESGRGCHCQRIPANSGGAWTVMWARMLRICRVLTHIRTIDVGEHAQFAGIG